MSLRFYVLYRLESLVTNLNLPWTSRSDDPFIRTGAAKTGNLVLGKMKKLKDNKRETLSTSWRKPS